MTLTELLDSIARLAQRHETELLQPDKLPALEKDPAMKPPIDWGVKTSAGAKRLIEISARSTSGCPFKNY